jgi:hypothetical protein
MNSKYYSPTKAILTLAIIFSLPVLACSLFTTNPPTSNNGNQETKMAADVQASLTANAETLAAQVTPTPEATLTPPPSPTQPMLPLSTDLPTPTNTRAPTRTPAAIKSPVPTGPWVGDITFASDISQNNQPINPGTVFKRGVTHIYAIFPYSGFEQGLKVTLYWTLNGKEFVSAVRTWQWDASGTYSPSTAYANNRQLDSGTWTFTIFANNKKLGSGTFKILP